MAEDDYEAYPILDMLTDPIVFLKYLILEDTDASKVHLSEFEKRMMMPQEEAQVIEQLSKMKEGKYMVAAFRRNCSLSHLIKTATPEDCSETLDELGLPANANHNLNITNSILQVAHLRLGKNHFLQRRFVRQCIVAWLLLRSNQQTAMQPIYILLRKLSSAMLDRNELAHVAGSKQLVTMSKQLRSRLYTQGVHDEIVKFLKEADDIRAKHQPDVLKPRSAFALQNRRPFERRAFQNWAVSHANLSLMDTTGDYVPSTVSEYSTSGLLPFAGLQAVFVNQQGESSIGAPDEPNTPNTGNVNHAPPVKANMSSTDHVLDAMGGPGAPHFKTFLAGHPAAGAGAAAPPVVGGGAPAAPAAPPGPAGPAPGGPKAPKVHPAGGTGKPKLAPPAPGLTKVVTSKTGTGTAVGGPALGTGTPAIPPTTTPSAVPSTTSVPAALKRTLTVPPRPTDATLADLHDFMNYNFDPAEDDRAEIEKHGELYSTYLKQRALADRRKFSERVDPLITEGLQAMFPLSPDGSHVDVQKWYDERANMLDYFKKKWGDHAADAKRESIARLLREVERASDAHADHFDASLASSGSAIDAYRKDVFAIMADLARNWKARLTSTDPNDMDVLTAELPGMALAMMSKNTKGDTNFIKDNGITDNASTASLSAVNQGPLSTAFFMPSIPSTSTAAPAGVTVPAFKLMDAADIAHRYPTHAGMDIHKLTYADPSTAPKEYNELVHHAFEYQIAIKTLTTDLLTAETELTTEKTNHTATAAALTAKEAELTSEQAAHATTSAALTSEQLAHAATKLDLTNKDTDLTNERAAHAVTQGDLSSEKANHTATQALLATRDAELAAEKASHTATQTELTDEKTAHATTAKEHADSLDQLKRATEDVTKTKKELDEVRTKLAVTQNEVDKLKVDLAAAVGGTGTAAAQLADYANKLATSETARKQLEADVQTLQAEGQRQLKEHTTLMTKVNTRLEKKFVESAIVQLSSQPGFKGIAATNSAELFTAITKSNEKVYDEIAKLQKAYDEQQENQKKQIALYTDQNKDLGAKLVQQQKLHADAVRMYEEAKKLIDSQNTTIKNFNPVEAALRKAEAENAELKRLQVEEASNKVRELAALKAQSDNELLALKSKADEEVRKNQTNDRNRVKSALERLMADHGFKTTDIELGDSLTSLLAGLEKMHTLSRQEVAAKVRAEAQQKAQDAKKAFHEKMTELDAQKAALQAEVSSKANEIAELQKLNTIATSQKDELSTQAATEIAEREKAIAELSATKADLERQLTESDEARKKSREDVVKLKEELKRRVAEMKQMKADSDKMLAEQAEQYKQDLERARATKNVSQADREEMENTIQKRYLDKMNQFAAEKAGLQAEIDNLKSTLTESILEQHEISQLNISLGMSIQALVEGGHELMMNSAAEDTAGHELEAPVNDMRKSLEEAGKLLADKNYLEAEAQTNEALDTAKTTGQSLSLDEAIKAREVMSWKRKSLGAFSRQVEALAEQSPDIANRLNEVAAYGATKAAANVALPVLASFTGGSKGPRPHQEGYDMVDRLAIALTGQSIMDLEDTTDYEAFEADYQGDIGTNEFLRAFLTHYVQTKTKHGKEVLPSVNILTDRGNPYARLSLQTMTGAKPRDKAELAEIAANSMARRKTIAGKRMSAAPASGATTSTSTSTPSTPIARAPPSTPQTVATTAATASATTTANKDKSPSDSGVGDSRDTTLDPDASSRRSTLAPQASALRPRTPRVSAIPSIPESPSEFGSPRSGLARTPPSLHSSAEPATVRSSVSSVPAMSPAPMASPGGFGAPSINSSRSSVHSVEPLPTPQFDDEAEAEEERIAAEAERLRPLIQDTVAGMSKRALTDPTAKERVPSKVPDFRGRADMEKMPGAAVLPSPPAAADPDAVADVDESFLADLGTLSGSEIEQIIAQYGAEVFPNIAPQQPGTNAAYAALGIPPPPAAGAAVAAPQAAVAPAPSQRPTLRNLAPHQQYETEEEREAAFRDNLQIVARALRKEAHINDPDISVASSHASMPLIELAQTPIKQYPQSLQMTADALEKLGLARILKEGKEDERVARILLRRMVKMTSDVEGRQIPPAEYDQVVANFPALVSSQVGGTFRIRSSGTVKADYQENLDVIKEGLEPLARDLQEFENKYMPVEMGDSFQNYMNDESFGDYVAKFGSLKDKSAKAAFGKTLYGLATVEAGIKRQLTQIRGLEVLMGLGQADGDPRGDQFGERAIALTRALRNISLLVDQVADSGIPAHGSGLYLKATKAKVQEIMKDLHLQLNPNAYAGARQSMTPDQSQQFYNLRKQASAKQIAVGTNEGKIGRKRTKPAANK